MLNYLGGRNFPIRPPVNPQQQSISTTGTILTEPLHFYCPFCSASIEVTSAVAAAKGVKVKCSGCQRKVEVPEGVLENFPDPDDDDDFLSGVPMVASGDEDILTEADLAVESGGTDELAAKSNLLDNDFEFSVADSASSVEAQEQEDDQEDDQSSANDGDDDSVDPETDVLLDDSQNESKTGGDEDLNQLLAGVAVFLARLLKKEVLGFVVLFAIQNCLSVLDRLEKR